MRELLFGFGEKKPESFEPWKERALIIYAWATWLYRFFLFCGIALLVYHAFFKLLGIFLFCVAVPRLSWRMEDGRQGAVQTSWRIVVDED